MKMSNNKVIMTPVSQKQKAIKTCQICSKQFEVHSPTQKYCSICAPEIYKEESRISHKLHPQHKTDLTRGNRRNKRKLIQNKWGKVPYHKGTNEWLNHITKSEEKGVMYLKEKGYSNIVKLTDTFSHFPFDIYSEKDNIRYLWQITMRTHIESMPKHRKFANSIGMQYKWLFIKPDLTIIIDNSRHELSLRDLEV